MKKPILVLLLTILASPLVFASDHVVEKGDTLYSLAREFGVSVDELMRANGIDDPRSLRIGQRLVIPGTGATESREETSGESRTVHVVKSGETLYGLAHRYGITVAELRRINGMDEDEVLGVGRELTVPSDEDEPEAASTPPPNDDSEPQSPAPPASSGDDVTWPHSGRRIQLTGNIKGMEILGAQGDDVVAVSRGEVVLVQPFRTYLKLVIVETDDHYVYIYGGCDDTFVKTGDEVEAGTRLGTLGIGPGGVSKVYFAVYKNSRLVDPALAPRL